MWLCTIKALNGSCLPSRSTPAAWQSQPQPQHGFSLLRPVCKAQATAKAAAAEAQLGAASPPPHSPPPPSDGSRTPPQQGESRSPYLLQAAAAASPSAPSPRAAVRPQAWLPSWDADRPSSPMRQRLELQAASQVVSPPLPPPQPGLDARLLAHWRMKTSTLAGRVSAVFYQHGCEGIAVSVRDFSSIP